MMGRVLGVALAAASMLAAHATPAAAQEKVRAYIGHSGDDSTGKQLAFLLRDQIRSSGTFVASPRYEDGGMQLHLVTMDPDDDGATTIYSASVTIYNESGYDYFVTSFVGICGRQRLTSCAQRLYANLGEQLEDIRKALDEQRSDRFAD